LGIVGGLEAQAVMEEPPLCGTRGGVARARLANVYRAGIELHGYWFRVVDHRELADVRYGSMRDQAQRRELLVEHEKLEHSSLHPPPLGKPLL